MMHAILRHKKLSSLTLGLTLILLIISGCSQKHARRTEADQYYYYQVYHDRPFIEMLYQVRSKIMISAEVTAEFEIIADSEPNAFMSIIGGQPHVFLTTGMIKLIGNSKDAYAFLMAHECAHIVQHHIDESRLHSKSLRKTGDAVISAIEIVGMAFGLPLGLFSSFTVDSGTQLASLKYNRDQEREADLLALDYMQDAGYEINGAIIFMEKLMSIKDAPSLPFLSTHPSYEERVAYLKNLVEEKRISLSMETQSK